MGSPGGVGGSTLGCPDPSGMSGKPWIREFQGASGFRNRISELLDEGVIDKDWADFMLETSLDTIGLIDSERSGKVSLPTTITEPMANSKQACSPDRQSGQEQARLPKLEPKHKIFLSHSGAQKDFVRQLCRDLEAETHLPFFDQRSSSLLKGKKFAPEIIAAAQRCHVAVIVLSEEYLTSKWPMLELVEFVKAKKSDNPELELFPLFFKITVNDLSGESFEHRWKTAWADIAKDDPDRFNLSWCTKALRELRGSNGLKFQDFQHSEVFYREAIVKEISLLLPPDLLDDTSDVIGYDRLCKITAGMFVQDISDDSKSWGTHKLGLYGMGGLGKTTMCRALCRYFHEDFYGRVCHVELGSKPPLELQKMVLTKLLRLAKEVVESITSAEVGRKCLKDNMRREPVFLVIDNITDDSTSRTEALAYLEAGFHPHSRIMITSRGEDVVQALFTDPKSTFCKAMPNLTEEEAGFIFLQRAAPQRALGTLTDEERRVLSLCLGQCCFAFDGRPIREEQYHPLALRALAVYYHEIDNMNVLSWENHLEDLDKLKHSRESSDVFGILGLQFSTFDMRKKLLFLDMALYYGTSCNSYEDCVSWLADIYEERRRAMECQLQHLKRSGIINFSPSVWGTNIMMITIHDLYKEFAEWYVSEWAGSEDMVWCVYHKLPTKCLPYALQRACASNFWPDLKRIWLQNLMCVSLPPYKVQEWRNIVVLQLHSCDSLTVLHLHGLSCLRHLELFGLQNLETFYFVDSATSDSKGSIRHIECLRPAQTTLESLQYVVLKKLISLKRLPDFSMCTLLKSFEMTECDRVLRTTPSFKRCSQLENLRMDWNSCQESLPKLNTLTSLTSLRIGSTCNMDCKGNARVLEGLGACTQLQGGLTLSSLPIRSLPGLEKLSQIRSLWLRNCRHLKEIPDVSALTQLKELNISLTMLRGIPGVDRLLKLERLICTMCDMLSTLPDLHQLPNLKFLNTQCCPKLRIIPRLPPQCLHVKDQIRLVKKTEHSSEFFCQAQFDLRSGETSVFPFMTKGMAHEMDNLHHSSSSRTPAKKV
ncbi:hypothetical protein M758_5G140600 [Ceratodon purpureus]|nr:hypothetical protein M758_5G140600 [Ceratodon purpureus]